MNRYARHIDDTADQTVATTPEVDTPEVQVDLGEDPCADGLSERLAAAATRRWRTRTTVVLACLVLLVGGFAGGLEVQKQWGASAATTATARPGGAGFGQGGAGLGLGY